MPTLSCYVDDVTMEILEREAIRRGRNESPTDLAENAIADAASQSVPPGVRGQIRAEQVCGEHRSMGRVPDDIVGRRRTFTRRWP